MADDNEYTKILVKWLICVCIQSLWDSLAFKKANPNNIAVSWTSYSRCFKIWKKLGHILNEGVCFLVRFLLLALEYLRVVNNCIAKLSAKNTVHSYILSKLLGIYTQHCHLLR